jgi:preprotein translocase subunit SecE
VSTSSSGAASRKPARKQSEKQGLFARIVLFIRQVVAELKKVVTPTRKEFATYVGVVLAFVVIMMIIISTFDLGVGVLVNSIFG